MTFYFYDLETSSGSPHRGRIMQFAGQRTNENVEPVGEPDNLLIKLSDDIVPEPDAILVHGITPQQTLADGLSEAEFAAYFHEKIAQPDTVFVGFNNIRFDDEFMRRLCYRTFYDPYQWHWKDGRSRWDMLDPFRMMRALRPEGMKWPDLNGKPTVKLELLAKENKIEHLKAHDALSDVEALISLSKQFKTVQPKLFDFLLNVRDKRAVAKIVEAGEPFVYTSGRYQSEYQKTTVVTMLFKHPRREAGIVYDLREDPSEWFSKSVDELIKHWRPAYGEDIKRLPVKTVQYNRCPALAPLGVLDDASKERIGLNDDTINKNLRSIQENKEFLSKLQAALDKLEHAQQTKFEVETESVDEQIYSGFWNDAESQELVAVRMADPSTFSQMYATIKNKRIREMMPLYKARNYPALLTVEEREEWEEHRREALYKGGKQSPIARFTKRMSELGSLRLSVQEEYLLTELQLYVESIIPDVEEN